MAQLKLTNISKQYENGFKAVSDVNLEIKDKEFIVLVGPSGCGKSTTLRMIAGLEDITSGELEIDGVVVNDLPPKERDIAMVFQNYALYPHMSVYDNMAFGLKLRKMPKDQINQKVSDAAKILQLESLLKRKPKVLSGGQRQRVALGRAIVRNPKVFLMDEPLSNLDAKLRAEMRTEISKLHKALDATFVYVTHDQIEAMTMGDRIVVMKDGFIQQIDTPQNLYDLPVNKFVAGFIGSPQMNFLPAILAEKEGNIFASIKNTDILIAIPGGKSSQLKEQGYLEKEIIIGIRPEDIHDEQAFIAASQDTVFDADVVIREIMGAETFAYLTFAQTQIIARFDGRTNIKPGDKLHLAMESNKLHFFDSETEKSIIFNKNIEYSK